MPPDDPAQPPVRPPVQPPAPSGGGHSGWAPGAYERFQEVQRENAQLKAKLQTAETELATAQADVTKYKGEAETASTKLTQQAERHGEDIAMHEAGGHLQHPDVREVVRGVYRRYRESAGEDAKSFGDWLKEDSTKSNPVIAPYLKAAEAAKEPGEPEKQAGPKIPAPPDPNKGADDNPTAGGRDEYTPEAIEALSKDPGRWAKHREAIKSQLERKYGGGLGGREAPKGA